MFWCVGGCCGVVFLWSNFCGYCGVCCLGLWACSGGEVVFPGSEILDGCVCGVLALFAHLD